MSLSACFFALLSLGQVDDSMPFAPPGLPPVRYRAWLDSPGGELPFELIIEPHTARTSFLKLINGRETIGFKDAVQWPNLVSPNDGKNVKITFPAYDSQIEGDADGNPPTVRGAWSKKIALGQFIEMRFHAEKANGYRFRPYVKMTEDAVPSTRIGGRWMVKFADDAQPAVGVFEEQKGNVVEGTFLTTTGDYRYLAGSYEHGLLRLSCFDGAHAFLFVAKMQVDSTLKGDFWSGPKGHDTWTAKRDEKAALPDAFTLTKINPKVRLRDLKFRDLDGKDRSPGDPALLGKCTIIEIFGSWCPNCHDAGEMLVGLEQRFGPRGLKIVGLAFEATGELSRDAKQVRTYLERHHATYPVLLAGVRDKTKASAALPVIDGLRGYPTFLFVDRNGEIRSVYTGFSGPATGAEYQRIWQDFQRTIEKLLAS